MICNASAAGTDDKAYNGDMHLRYETGVATFVQFIIGAGLSFMTGVASIISGCRGASGADCITNTFVSLILIILTIVAFSFLAGLGYVAQDRRSSRLALALIGFELLAMLIFLFDALHSPDILSKLINFVSFVVALWVLYIAWKLYRAKGARIVRARRRPHAQ